MGGIKADPSLAKSPSLDGSANEREERNAHRYPGLDVLRFVAVTMVLHVHAASGEHPISSLADLPAYGWIFPAGRYGVDLFFVLSGFLVSGLLFAEFRARGEMSLKRFFIRRAFKIYPAFWVMIGVSMMVRLYRGEDFHWRGLGAELLFVQNYLPGLWDHTWSLGVEEQFYLLLIGWFLFLRMTASPGESLNVQRIPQGYKIAFVICMVGRCLSWWYLWQTPLQARWHAWPTHLRVDALFFGMLLAYWWHFRWNANVKKRLASWNWAFIAVGIILMSSLTSMAMSRALWEITEYLVVYFGAGCLVLASLSLKASGKWNPWTWMAWIGKHSYSIYLWHMMILDWMKSWVKSPNPGLEVGYHLLCWSFGIMVARLIEFPMLRLRDRWFPACGQVVEAAKPT